MTGSHKVLPRALALLRAGYGVVLLTRPERIAEPLGVGPLDDRAKTVARVLGGRQVAQGALLAAKPTPGLLLLSALVDAAHAASMVGLARVDQARRHAALVDSAVATSFGLSSLVSRRSASS